MKDLLQKTPLTSWAATSAIIAGLISLMLNSSAACREHLISFLGAAVMFIGYMMVNAGWNKRWLYWLFGAFCIFGAVFGYIVEAVATQPHYQASLMKVALCLLGFMVMFAMAVTIGQQGENVKSWPSLIGAGVVAVIAGVRFKDSGLWTAGMTLIAADIIQRTPRKTYLAQFLMLLMCIFNSLRWHPAWALPASLFAVISLQAGLASWSRKKSLREAKT